MNCLMLFWRIGTTEHKKFHPHRIRSTRRSWDFHQPIHHRSQHNATARHTYRSKCKSRVHRDAKRNLPEARQSMAHRSATVVRIPAPSSRATLACSPIQRYYRAEWFSNSEGLSLALSTQCARLQHQVVRNYTSNSFPSFVHWKIAHLRHLRSFAICARCISFAT